MPSQQTNVRALEIMSKSVNTRDAAGRRGGSRSPVVMPSSELDAHLHTTAAQITKRKGSKVAWNDVEDEATDVVSGCHGDDLMTPPDVLLQLALREAEKAPDDETSVERWIRCSALAKVVYGDSHWMLAKTLIQLAKAYQQLRGLHEQALMHATKGRDILLSPSGHMINPCDKNPESMFQLSLAHCIIGKALTHLERLPEAERALVKAERCSERYSKMADSGGADVELDLVIVTGMGHLSLKQKKYNLAKACFTKAVDYTKAAHGTNSALLIPLLKQLANAELQTSNSRGAMKLLEEALQIAEQSSGVESLPAADVCMCLARAQQMSSSSASSDGDSGVAGELIERALAIYTSQHGASHEVTISCKDELCQLLSLKETSRSRAEELIKEVIADKKKTFGETSQEVGHSYKLLGTVSLSSGKLTQARRYLEKAKHIYSLSYGPRHSETQSLARALEIITESKGLAHESKRPIFKTTV